MRWPAVVTLSIFLSSCAQSPVMHGSGTGDQQVIVDWNARVLAIAEAEDGFLTLKGLRTTAMMHLAMTKALAQLEQAAVQAGMSNAVLAQSQITAVNQSAFVIANSQYPDKADEWSAIEARWAQSRPQSTSPLNVGSLARSAAELVLRQRKNDGWNTPASYNFHPMGPGVYAEFNEHSGTPDGFIFGAGWANAKGFGLSKPSQFRVPPPPDINSERYSLAFNEVKEAGRFQSYTRSPDQTHLALWWKDFVENSHNRLARELAVRSSLSIPETARLFALLNMSIFDAYISSFENKFHYNHWRPYTAIRWAANDGNDKTRAEATWTNTHQHTYAFPSYPSAHGTACASAMRVLEHFFGHDFAFEMRTETVDISGPFSGKIVLQPSTRRFTSFENAARECAASRVYLGIHFRYDSDAGFHLGRKIGQQIVDKFAD